MMIYKFQCLFFPLFSFLILFNSFYFFSFLLSKITEEKGVLLVCKNLDVNLQLKHEILASH